MNDSTPDQAPGDLREEIARRVNEIQIKLLAGIERNIVDGVLPSPHLEAYDALCRAERTRLGI